MAANTGNTPAGANAPPPPAGANAPPPPAGANVPGANAPPPPAGTNIKKNSPGNPNNAKVLGKNNKRRAAPKVGAKDKTQKFFSQNGLLIGVIVVVIVSMGAYYWHAYKKYKESEEALEMSKIPNVCPDYWVNSSGSKGNKKTLKCENVKRIGRCNLTKGNNIKDFSGELYKDPQAKCNWSKFCNAPWEGYDHLCADV